MADFSTTLTADLTTSDEVIHVADNSGARTTYPWRLVVDDEAMYVFDGVAEGLDWGVHRGADDTDPAEHLAGALATADAVGDAIPLNEVLALGNDTGGAEIVNVAAPDEDATATLAATATGGGAARTNTTATSEDGDAEAIATATSATGDAYAQVIAVATDGVAHADREASSVTWRAQADTSVVGGDTVHANTNATSTGDGNATVLNGANVGGTGTATVSLRAATLSDSHIASIVVTATATGETIVLTGLPTSDPVNAGQLWNDAGILMVSAG